MLTHFLAWRRHVGMVSAVVAASCSFYTDCPCANQPAGAANTNNAAGTGGGAAAGGAPNTGGTGGITNFQPGGAAGNEEGGNAGETQKPPPAVWQRAVGDLAGRSAACGQINFISAKPDEDLVIVSVNQNGFWGTRDGGATWKPLGTGAKSALISNTPRLIVYDPDDANRFWESGIYGPIGVYRTDDDGVNFTALGALMDTGINHNDYVSIDFSDPERRLMLAGGHEQGGTLYRSTDAGVNWEKLGDAVPSTCEFSSFPVVVDAENWLLGCRSSILGTSDAGKTWEIRSSYGGATAPLIASTGTIYWTIELGGGLVKSDDSGATWERVVGGGVIAEATPIELPDGSLAALGISGNSSKVIVRSTDGGTSWDTVTAELPFSADGFAYARRQGAFYVWHGTQTCETKIPDDVVLRYAVRF